MTRTEARELLMQLLFQMEVQNDYSDESKIKFFADKMKQANSQMNYINEMVAYVREHISDIDVKLNATSEKWNTSRMNKTDLAVLRIALAEIEHMDDIPSSVAINEAVTMGKKYGTENSGKFINGVLGKIVKENDEQ